MTTKREAIPTGQPYSEGSCRGARDRKIPMGQTVLTLENSVNRDRFPTWLDVNDALRERNFDAVVSKFGVDRIVEPASERQVSRWVVTPYQQLEIQG